MRAVVQRVKEASVKVDGDTVGLIGAGFLVLLGVAKDDGEKDASYTADKVAGLRVFDDGDGKFNLSLTDVEGAVLAVSQFTLYGDARGGRRPSFTEAAGAELGRSMYELFIDKLESKGIEVQRGVFGAKMEVALVNDGPVTILIDSRKQF
ncbi:MAG TPA: D-aminoacyl-tRNA deacylase [Bacillota bacterium]|nr:D-aminoacyl-tRNA deacylase [Bacillota bacterium]HOH10688.1 D-aminoacyl-tRNA deacylase [Bacillota bacterium]HOS50497.1 D-aminoacyl-tRNA deacylase [Bacillota bacterium]HOY89973.1 D-aminoacyl-tRNA deacylase [Bacillota bacterium]HPI01308.1 D-aminoacyl-tRNA deacylase [Bacillota bacterium]